MYFDACYLVQFPGFFVFRVLPALWTIFTELELFRRIELAPLGHVVLSLTHDTSESRNDTLFFFCHTAIIAQLTGVTQAVCWKQSFPRQSGQKVVVRHRSNGYDRLH